MHKPLSYKLIWDLSKTHGQRGRIRFAVPHFAILSYTIGIKKSIRILPDFCRNTNTIFNHSGRSECGANGPSLQGGGVLDDPFGNLRLPLCNHTLFPKIRPSRSVLGSGRKTRPLRNKIAHQTPILTACRAFCTAGRFLIYILPHCSVTARIFAARAGLSKPGSALQVQFLADRVPGSFIRASPPSSR